MRKRFTAEEIVRGLRGAEVSLAQGERVALVCKGLGIRDLPVCVPKTLDFQAAVVWYNTHVNQIRSGIHEH